MKTFRFMNKKLVFLEGDNTKAEVALFDATNSGPILAALQGFRVLVIPARGEFYYISFGIIWTMASLFATRIWSSYFSSQKNEHSLRSSLRLCYFGAVIKRSRSRVVVTYIDNSPFYHLLSHTLTDLPFLSFQNGSRYRYDVDSVRLPIKNFFCFGQYEVDLYRQADQQVENFICFGLLTTLNYLAHDPPPLSKEFDIFYPSQFHDNIQYGASTPFEKSGQDRVIGLVKAILAAYPSMTVLIGLRSAGSLEKDFYLQVFDNSPRVLFSQKTSAHSSYDAARRCRIVLSFTSTLVEEAMSWGQKAMYVHLTPDPRCFFVNPHWQECLIQGISEDEAIAAVLRVLTMPLEDYQRITSTERNYMLQINRPSERIMILRQFLKEIVDRRVHAKALGDVLQKYFPEVGKGVRHPKLS